MSKKFYKDIDKTFSSVSDALNQFCYSKVLQDCFFSSFKSFIYGNLINNFFINLNKNNVNEYKLVRGKIGIIRNKYKNFQREAKLAISLSLKDKYIDENYYQTFKLNLSEEFPDFMTIIIEIEKEIDIKRLESNLREKKKSLKNIGKNKEDFTVSLITRILEIYIQKNNYIPSVTKINIITKEIGKDVLPIISKELTKDLIKDKAEIITYRKTQDNKIITKIYQKWKEPFELLECLIQISQEIGEKCKDKFETTISNTRNYKRSALIMLHARALQISNEISTLLKAGYADGANARWRSLHELAIISIFLKSNSNNIAKRYFEHKAVKSYKEAKDYRAYYKKLGYPPLRIKEFNNLKREFDRLCDFYNDRFQDDYGWIPSIILRNRNFRELEKHVRFDKFRPFYNLACNSIHGGSKGFYRLGLIDELQDKLLLIGSSIYGHSDPLQTTAISLSHINSSLLTLEPDFENIIQIYVMKYFVDKICDKAAKVNQKLTSNL